MKKQTKNAVFGTLLCTMMLSSLTACGMRAKAKEESESKEAEGKTRVSITNFTGGFGDEWLRNAISEYQELNKDKSFEPGKTGVVLKIDNGDKSTWKSERIAIESYDLWFTEQANYADHVANNVLTDITDVLTSPNSYDNGKTILSKLDESQKEFYNANNKYYALPHYTGTYGITYNAKMFEENGWYYVDGKDNVTVDTVNFNQCFMSRSQTSGTKKLSAGPDGQYNTEDDGLPTCIDNYFALCARIEDDGYQSLRWSGETGPNYLASFASDYMASLYGPDQAKVAYNFSGQLNHLLTYSQSGDDIIVNDTLESQPIIQINNENAYEMFRTKERYDVLKFIETAVSDDRFADEDEIFGDSTQLACQQDYVLQNAANTTPSKSAAMMIDGTWWEAEAKTAFVRAQNDDEEYNILTAPYKFMPYPKASYNDQYTPCYVDHLNALAFVRAGVTGGVLDVCKDFLKFLYSDEQLVKFTKSTHCLKSVNYEISAQDLEEVSVYGQSVIAYRNKATVVYPISKSAIFLNNLDTLSAPYQWNVQGSAFAPSLMTLKNRASQKNAGEVLGRVYKFYKTDWSSRL